MSESPQPITGQLKAERIQAMLKQLPLWELRRDGKAIRRVWAVPDLYVGSVFASALACTVDHHQGEATMMLTAATVAVALSTTAAGGVTERDIRVAEALEFGG